MSEISLTNIARDANGVCDEAAPVASRIFACIFSNLSCDRGISPAPVYLKQLLSHRAGKIWRVYPPPMSGLLALSVPQCPSRESIVSVSHRIPQ